jgi:hypothetical protein
VNTKKATITTGPAVDARAEVAEVVEGKIDGFAVDYNHDTLVLAKGVRTKYAGFAFASLAGKGAAHWAVAAVEGSWNRDTDTGTGDPAGAAGVGSVMGWQSVMETHCLNDTGCGMRWDLALSKVCNLQRHAAAC